MDNTYEKDQEEGLLIDKDKDNNVLNNGAQITLKPTGKEKLKGSFTVRTRELGKKSSAAITLTLIAQYEDPSDTTKKREVEIPYTIIIQNYNTSTTN